MVKILVINKSCDIEQKVYKLEDESELYKKAGFKTMVGFEKIHSWFIDTEGISECFSSNPSLELNWVKSSTDHPIPIHLFSKKEFHAEA